MVPKILLLLVGYLAVIAQGSSLNGQCRFDNDCGTVDSFCNNGTCVCKDTFAYHGDACIQVLSPRLECRQDTECHTILGRRSICKDRSCACLPYHHLYNSMCLKNRGLHERCDEDYACYWGEDMINKMSCISGECSCKSGFRPYSHRKCESGANSLMVVYGTLLAFSATIIRLL